MEGPRWKPSWRRIGARPAAVLLAIGALSVGLAACGSSSSSGSSSANGSASAVVEKQAGYSDVELNLVNKSPERLYVFLCQDTNGLGQGDCGNGTYLDTGESTHLTSAAVGGIIHYPNGKNSMEFRAKNPDIGAPSFEIWGYEGKSSSTNHATDENQQAAEYYKLDEGQTVEKDFGSHLFDMWRSNDTDVKRMQLTVLH
jgi:hypothetical protein